ncbi:hypothetical protein LIER_44011 [Lithospermum erythrorhizon]|uniref:Retrotransposon gag domain-containing protein n=1 Tax=Lithospermum erythrorhizon TaxID=34254 RepID=A0AAV3RNN2_LITER
MTIALETRDKYGFVNGEILEPATDDVNYKQWRKVNSTLISWILNAISADLSKGFIYPKTAKQLWDKIVERFGKSNGPKVFELKRSIYSAKQGSYSVNVYYNKLKDLWDELDCLKPKNVDDDEDKMMQFLMGLNMSMRLL